MRAIADLTECCVERKKQGDNFCGDGNALSAVNPAGGCPAVESTAAPESEDPDESIPPEDAMLFIEDSAQGTALEPLTSSAPIHLWDQGLRWSFGRP